MIPYLPLQTGCVFEEWGLTTVLNTVHNTGETFVWRTPVEAIEHLKTAAATARQTQVFLVLDSNGTMDNVVSECRYLKGIWELLCGTACMHVLLSNPNMDNSNTDMNVIRKFCCDSDVQCTWEGNIACCQKICCPDAQKGRHLIVAIPTTSMDTF